MPTTHSLFNLNHINHQLSVVFGRYIPLGDNSIDDAPIKIWFQHLFEKSADLFSAHFAGAT